MDNGAGAHGLAAPVAPAAFVAPVQQQQGLQPQFQHQPPPSQDQFIMQRQLHEMQMQQQQQQHLANGAAALAAPMYPDAFAATAEQQGLQPQFLQQPMQPQAH